MTNAEKFKGEIFNDITKELKPVLTKKGKFVKCTVCQCKDCVFHRDDGSCRTAFIKWLLSEYKEKIKLSRFEYEFLKNLNKQWKWIVRDEEGTLFLFPEKPRKYQKFWICKEYCKVVQDVFDTKIFDFIKWDDEEPYEIKSILENCEVMDDE